MRKKNILCICLGATMAVIFATCAPVEQPEKETEPLTSKGVVEQKILPQPKLTREVGPESRIEAAVQNVRARYMRTSNGFWTVFHAILGLGPSCPIINEQTGQKLNALEYICNGGELRGLGFLPTKHGLDVEMGKPFVAQGHQDQFIAELAQWNMPADRKFIVKGKEYTYMDFANHSKATASVKANQELSWAIIVIGQYFGQDISWTNEKGEKLHYEDIVRYELDASVEDSACGGTHRLFGLDWALHIHLQKGGKEEGIWKEIVQKTEKYRDLAKKYQNSDGSLSTNWFRGPGNNSDKNARISTTGHMLEWLSLALSPAELKEQWVADAASALALTILDGQGEAIEGGALYHATHGLLMYYARVYNRKTLGPSELFIQLPPEWAADMK